MLYSMTGYGVETQILEGVTATIQIKSVNTRYLDIFIRFPGVPPEFEQVLRERIKARVSRGRIDFAVDIRSAATDIRHLNTEVAVRYADELQLLRSTLGLQDEIRIRDLMALPGVLETTETNITESEAFQAGFLELLNSALDQFIAMRAREGEALQEVIRQRLATIEEDLGRIAAGQDENRALQFDRLHRRLEEILSGKVQLDEARLVQEVAYLTDRTEIAEELDRFHSHIRQFRDTLDEGSPAGKKLDFILQEMNREINTILSKTDIMDISRCGINVKAELEKIREQIQNVE